ncbi:glycosyltransferase [Candidatus Fermentibacteria bacterium]|nr:glycosyltransferase [Candidatus Fermentibacteria bacterium]
MLRRWRLDKVAVLLVNLDQWELTRQCVESLMRSEGVSVYPMLLDNASSDPVPGWVEEVPNLRFFRSEKNLGFAGGNNRAYSLYDNADIPWTFVLNNDTTVSPDTLGLLVGLLKERPDVGIATPAVFYAERPDIVWSAGGRLQRLRMVFDARIHPDRKSLPEKPVETGFASGCAMMMASSMYEKLGGFREGFFIYHEDSLMCLRCLRMGRKIMLHPGAEVLHHVSVTTGGVMSPFSIYFTHRNRFLAAREELSPLEMIPFTCYYLGITLLKTILFPLRGYGRSVVWMWRGALDAVREREGGMPPGLGR